MDKNWLQEPILGFKLEMLPCRCYKSVKGNTKGRPLRYCERVVFADFFYEDYWPRAVFWYGKASMQNEPFAVQEMKRIEEFKDTERKAKDGDADAQYLLAVYYFYRYGIYEDYNKGSKWAWEAVINGSKVARKSCHKYLSEERNRIDGSNFLPPVILPKGFKFYNLTKRHGMKNCRYASKYCIDMPWDKFSKLDFEETEKSANEGDAEKQYQLAWLYDRGHGVRPDIQRAVEWFVKSAYNGYAPAQTELGIMYQYGIEATVFSLDAFGKRIYLE